MADIYGSHFEYFGVSSRSYGLMIANIETSRYANIAGEISGISVFNKKTNTKYLIDDDYSNFPVSFEIEIITDDESIIENTRRREIEKWLFNKKNYGKLYVDAQDDCFGDTYEIIDGTQKRLYLNCRFINPERIEYNGGIVGYRVTLEADSGMWWQDAIIKTFNINNSQTGFSIISVNVDTDINDYTYPKITFVTGDIGGDIIITNITDSESRITKLVNIPPLTTITMRGDLNFISGNHYSSFYKSNFVRLLDGNNNLKIDGDVSLITIEYQNRRFL